MSWNVKWHNEVRGKLIRLLTTLNSPRHRGEGCKAHFGSHQTSQRLKLCFQVCQRDGRLVTLLLNKCLQCPCDELLLVFRKQTLQRNLWSVNARYQVHTSCYRQHYTACYRQHYTACYRQHYTACYRQHYTACYRQHYTACYRQHYTACYRQHYTACYRQHYTACYRQQYTHILCHRMKKATVWNVCIKSFYNFSKRFLRWRLLEEAQMIGLSLMETNVHS